MPGNINNQTGLVYQELSHIWGHGAPSMPGDDDVSIHRAVKHAQHGVMAQRLRMVMHSGTHLNAPIHLIQKGIGVGEIPLHQLFGNGVIVSIPKGPWELVSAEDIASATPAISEGDLVIIVTGWHHKYADSLEYFGDSPGLSVDAAQWLVDKKVALVGVDTPQVDHPMATSLGQHRGGPLMNRVCAKYTQATGLDPIKEHPVWNAAHKVLLGADIPTVENVGGDVDAVAGKSALIHALPWKFEGGDACPVRLVAILDPGGEYRIEAGSAS